MILIVDDNPENIFSLRKILELNNFLVDVALSGEEALKKILKTSYALILLDVQMPGMDGFEVPKPYPATAKQKISRLYFYLQSILIKDILQKVMPPAGLITLPNLLTLTYCCLK